MKQKLFPEIADPGVLIEALEAQCTDIEANYKYVKPFSKKEHAETVLNVSRKMVDKKRLKAKMDDIIAPLKEEMKEIESNLKSDVKNLDQGGITTHGKVYCFPDWDSNLMGIYDELGNLVDTRPLLREERQMHISSQINKASNE